MTGLSDKQVAHFWGKVDKSGDCWIWQGAKTPFGYGMAFYGKRRFRVHRLAYELEVGPIPQGLVIDHLCHVRDCVNPKHLEPVTVVENSMRQPYHEVMRTATHCKRGHPFDEANTAIQASTGRRRCRKCRSIRHVRHEQKLSGTLVHRTANDRLVEAQSWLRTEGFVFATDPSKPMEDRTDAERWERLAFSLYTLLCEADWEERDSEPEDEESAA